MSRALGGLAARRGDTTGSRLACALSEIVLAMRRNAAVGGGAGAEPDSPVDAADFVGARSRSPASGQAAPAAAADTRPTGTGAPSTERETPGVPDDIPGSPAALLRWLKDHGVSKEVWPYGKKEATSAAATAGESAVAPPVAAGVPSAAAQAPAAVRGSGARRWWGQLRVSNGRFSPAEFEDPGPESERVFVHSTRGVKFSYAEAGSGQAPVSVLKTSLPLLTCTDREIEDQRWLMPPNLPARRTLLARRELDSTLPWEEHTILRVDGGQVQLRGPSGDIWRCVGSAELRAAPRPPVALDPALLSQPRPPPAGAPAPAPPPVPPAGPLPSVPAAATAPASANAAPPVRDAAQTVTAGEASGTAPTTSSPGVAPRLTGSDADELLCGVCFELPMEAEETGCCGRVVCTPCNRNWQRVGGNARCPWCRSAELMTRPSAFVRRKIAAMPCRCPAGCGAWLESIGAAGRTVVRHLSRCPAAKRVCLRCDAEVALADDSSHGRELCTDKVIDCPGCSALCLLSLLPAHLVEDSSGRVCLNQSRCSVCGTIAVCRPRDLGPCVDDPAKPLPPLCPACVAAAVPGSAATSSPSPPLPAASARAETEPAAEPSAASGLAAAAECRPNDARTAAPASHTGATGPAAERPGATVVAPSASLSLPQAPATPDGHSAARPARPRVSPAGPTRSDSEEPYTDGGKDKEADGKNQDEQSPLNSPLAGAPSAHERRAGERGPAGRAGERGLAGRAGMVPWTWPWSATATRKKSPKKRKPSRPRKAGGGSQSAAVAAAGGLGPLWSPPPAGGARHGPPKRRPSPPRKAGGSPRRAGSKRRQPKRAGSPAKAMRARRGERPPSPPGPPWRSR